MIKRAQGGHELCSFSARPVVCTESALPVNVMSEPESKEHFYSVPIHRQPLKGE